MTDWTKWEDLPELALPGEDRVVENNRYQVRIEELPTRITHLSIKRLKKEAIHDWRELLRIKNELCGQDREAIEIYPGMWRVVDTVNQYHLWVMPKGVGINLGFLDSHVEDEAPDRFVPGSPRQRPLPAWLERVNSGDRSHRTRCANGSDGSGGLGLLFPLIFASVDATARVDDMESDEFHLALARVQGDIGVDDGGFAGIFFMEHEETWERMPYEDRVKLLVEYMEREKEGEDDG